MIRCKGTQIEADHLPPGLDSPSQSIKPDLTSGSTLREQMERTEKAIIEQSLRLADGNRSKASQLLGIHRTGLYQKMKKYRIAG